jgi:type I restriction enzyme S subunit
MKPYLRVANVYADRLELSDIAEIATTAEEFARTRLQPGDVLIVEGNGSVDQIGRAAIWEGELDECAHQNHLIRWRCRGPVLPAFALFWLLSPRGRASLMEAAKSSAGLFTLSLSKVAAVRIQVPSPEEQQEIVTWVRDLLTAADQLESRVQHARERVEQAVPATLAKAFRGELVPQDPNDEPASVMLERLRAQRSAAEADESRPTPTRGVPARAKTRTRPREAPPKKRRAS